MLKKDKVGNPLILFLVLSLLFYMVSPGSSSSNDNESKDSEFTNEDSTLPDYGPQVFEEAKKRPGFVATRGTMPVITNANEKVKWTDLLINCTRSLADPYNSNEGINQYFTEFGNPVMSFGTHIDGYLLVQFEGYSSEKVNESLIDEIYQVIDERCEQEGISDVPVVFEYGGYIVEGLAVDNGPDADETDANISDNEETTNNKTNTQSPGFTSIMVILGLLLLSITKHL